jgi:hypothetical protein
MIKKEEIPHLDQLIDTLEIAMERLEEYHKEKDVENFNKTKKFIMDIQKQIRGIVNE